MEINELKAKILNKIKEGNVDISHILRDEKENEIISELERSFKENALNNIKTERPKPFLDIEELKAQRDYMKQLTEMLKEKDEKIAEISQIYDESAQKVEKEKADLEDKISRLTFELEAKDKKMAEIDQAYNTNIQKMKDEIGSMTVKLKSAKKERSNLEDKLSRLASLLETKDKKMAEIDQTNRKNIQAIKNAMEMKLQAVEREKSDLEVKIFQQGLDLKTMADRHENDRALAEKRFGNFKAEIDIMKSLIEEKKKIEADLKETVLCLKSEIAERDKKIETDTNYCARLLKEINQLRKVEGRQKQK